MDVNVKGWTFTHWWVRPVVKVWFGVYHKTVTYSGTEHIDWNKPIIFAPSHQNAFSDALCIILPARYTNNRFIYPLIRADAFGKHRLIDWILTSFHMIPVYRPRDNVDLKARNESIFSICHDLLVQNRNLLIHPEGNCIAEKRVRKLKKGLARIAFGAEELHDFDIDLQIIPMGINYRSITEARKGIHIRFEEPIPVIDFVDRYKENPATGIRELTDQIKEEIERTSVNIPTGDRYPLYENLIRIITNSHPSLSSGNKYSREELSFHKQLAGKFSAIEQNNSENILDQVKSIYKNLRSVLKQNKLSEELPLVVTESSLSLVFKGVAFLILSPLIGYGWINNLIPWKTTHLLADRVKEPEFKSSVRLVLGLLLFPLFYLIQTGVVFMFTGNWIWMLIYLISLPITGILSLNLLEKFGEWKQQIRLKVMDSDQKEALSGSIQQLRSLLRDSVSLSSEPD